MDEVQQVRSGNFSGLGGSLGDRSKGDLGDCCTANIIVADDRNLLRDGIIVFGKGTDDVAYVAKGSHCLMLRK